MVIRRKELHPIASVQARIRVRGMRPDLRSAGRSLDESVIYNLS